MSIILNVSGRIFKVSRDVICKSELFNNMLADCEINDEIMVDRSAKLFEHVYAYLLDNKYPYPRKYYSELDYYLVQYDIDLLYDSNKKIDAEISQLKKNQCTMLQEIMVLTLTRDTESNKCMRPNCSSQRQDGSLLCYQDDTYCCYHIDYVGSCNKRIRSNQAYCSDHVLSYFKEDDS